MSKFVTTVYVEIEIPEEVIEELNTLEGNELRKLCESMTNDMCEAIRERINASQGHIKVKGKTLLKL